MKRISLWMMVLGMMILPLAGRAQEEKAKKVKVVATLSTLKWLAEEIGGDLVKVDSLAFPTQDPHFLTAKPSFQSKAQDCDLFIELGMQLDIWAQDVVDGSGNVKIQTGQPGRVIASSNVKALELPAVLTREWGDIHPYGNPHIWTDPLSVRQMAKNVEEGLKKVDSNHTKEYAKRYADFKKRLDDALFGAELVKAVGGDKLVRLAQAKEDSNETTLAEYLEEKKLTDKLGGWMKKAQTLKGAKLITYHKSWIYFTERFGMEIRGEIEEKPGIPPPAKYLDALIKKIQQEKIHLIEVDPFYSVDEANSVAKETGAKVLVMPLEVGEGKETADYFKLVDYWIDHYVEALKTAAKEK